MIDIKQLTSIEQIILDELRDIRKTLNTDRNDDSKLDEVIERLDKLETLIQKKEK